MRLTLERFLAVVGTAVCTIISIRVWQVIGSQQPMWPLPGLYLLEMMALSVGAMLSILCGAASSRVITWIVVGVVCAFVVMGAWSIGLLYLPVAVLFALAAILTDRRHRQSSARYVRFSIVAGVAQVALMLIIIRLLYPTAVF